MEYIRKNGMIDINDALNRGLIIFNEAERKGKRSNKFWFNDYTWMYKDVDNEYETYEEYAEVICYEIANLLNINCAEYDLATHNGRKGVITKSVVNHNEKIISGTELLNFVYEDYFIPQLMLHEKFTKLLEEYNISTYEEFEKLPEESKNKFSEKLIEAYNQSCFSVEDFIVNKDSCNIISLFEHCKELNELYPKDFIDMKNGIVMSNNLYDIWYAVEVFCKISGYSIDIEKFMSDLTNMFIFDIIVNQGDRHADNWSVVINKDTDELKLAAIYDNSGSFSLNREKALANINEFSKRLKIEKKPGKIKGIKKKMSETINHTFSGVKVTYENIQNRSKNDELIETYISHSSDEFIEKIEKAIELLSDDNLIMIFKNIESKTGEPVPEIVQNTTKEILKHNIERLQEKIALSRGDQNGNRQV